MLLWARAQREKIDFKPRKQGISSIIKEVLNVLEPSATLKNISINFNQPDDVIAFVDKNELDIVLHNLIQNAIKFTDYGGKVDVYFFMEQDQLNITIKDNGVGMDQKTIEKLFKVDLNFTSVGTANERGSGLGLLLCKEFVDNHNGEILVKSELGKGSEFLVRIPDKTA